MKKTVLSLALSALIPVAAHAASNEPIEIVITAKSQQSVADVAATSHVITAEQIEASQANDLAEVVDSVVGVNVSRNGGRGSQSGTFIRGASSNQIVVLVDGVRMSSATLGSTDLGHIPADMIERVEIVKGPLSGLYGADAIGGVIQVFTKKASDVNSISIEAGSFGHQKVISSFSSGNFSLSVSDEKTDGIDAHTGITGGNDDKDGFKETAVNLAYSHDVSENTTARINLLNSKNKIEFDNTFGADTGFYSDNNLSNLTLNVETDAKSGTKYATTVGYTTNDSETPAFFSTFNTGRLSLTTQGTFNVSDAAQVVAGLDYVKEDITSNASFAKSDRTNTGLFAQYQRQINSVGLVANLRADDNSAYGTNTNGSLALTVPVSKATRLVASYGTAFRAPTFNDLYYPYGGNVEIQPEESTSAEIGLRGGAGNLQWSVSAYDTQIENLIQYPAPNYEATNTSEVSLQGYELALNTLVNGWKVSTSLNLLDAIDESTGKALIRRPEQTFKLGLSRQFDKLNFSSNLINESGRTDSYAELEDYTKLDLAGTYQVADNFTISAKVGNALDEDYELASGYNTEGTSFQLGGKITF